MIKFPLRYPTGKKSSIEIDTRFDEFRKPYQINKELIISQKMNNYNI